MMLSDAEFYADFKTVLLLDIAQMVLELHLVKWVVTNMHKENIAKMGTVWLCRFFNSFLIFPPFKGKLSNYPFCYIKASLFESQNILRFSEIFSQVGR